MMEAVNLYLKSAQDTAMPQMISTNDIKNIDSVIDNYKELIENHDLLDEKFSKYKETQKLKNYKDSSLINEKQESIDNLTNIIKKLERTINNYKKNAEKKFVAQNELHAQELSTLEKENNDENKKVHKFMQDMLNERIDNANNVIKEIASETDEGVKQIKQVKGKKTQKKKKKTQKKKKKTQKKKKSKSKSKSKKKGA